MTKGWCTRHLPFVLFLLILASAGGVYLSAFYPYDLSVDEFQAFEQARGLLRDGRFGPQGIDPYFLPGLPRGAVFTFLVAGAMSVGGVGEIAARVPALMAALGAMLLAYFWVYRACRSRAAAFLSALALGSTPLFFAYAFVCRMYTLVILLQLLLLVLVYAGFEAQPRANGGFLAREGLRIWPWLLVVPLYLAQLNQHAALLLWPLALGGYATLLCAANIAALALHRRAWFQNAPLARRFQWKYAALAVPAVLLSTLLAAYTLSGYWPQSGILILDRARDFIDGQFDLHFAQRNPHLWNLFFPWPWGLCAIPLLFAGIWGFARNSHTPRLGAFLGVQYALFLAAAVFAWQRSEPRYALFLLALHAPLLGMGAWTLARLVTRRLGRAASAAALMLGLCLIVLPYAGRMVSGDYLAEAATKPFGVVEYRQAYGYVLSHADVGDALGLQYPREYYLEQAVRATGRDMTTLARFDLGVRSSFSLRALGDQMHAHPRGWLVWAGVDTPHIASHVRAAIEQLLTAHPATAHDTVRVYSWNPEQAAQIAAQLPVVFEQVLIVLPGAIADAEAAAAVSRILETNEANGLPLAEYVGPETRLRLVASASPSELEERAAPDLIRKHFSPAAPERCVVSRFQFEGAPLLFIAQQL